MRRRVATADWSPAELCQRTHFGPDAGENQASFVYRLFLGRVCCQREPQWTIFYLFVYFLYFQENENACVGPTASVLLGDPAAPLDSLQAPNTEDLNAVERLRDRLQLNWRLLQTTSKSTATVCQQSVSFMK